MNERGTNRWWRTSWLIRALQGTFGRCRDQLERTNGAFGSTAFTAALHCLISSPAYAFSWIWDPAHPLRSAAVPPWNFHSAVEAAVQSAMSITAQPPARAPRCSVVHRLSVKARLFCFSNFDFSADIWPHFHTYLYIYIFFTYIFIHTSSYIYSFDIV